MRRQVIAFALGALLAPSAPTHGDDARALLTRGKALEQEGKLDDAATAYEGALKLAPRMAEAHDRLGFVRGQQGRTADALAGFRGAAALNPALFDAQYHLGATLWWTKDARRRGRRPARGGAPAARARRGAVLPGPHAASRQGDLQAALERLRRAVRLAPDLAAAHLQLGVALHGVGRRRRRRGRAAPGASRWTRALDARNASASR